jgi:histidinol dehydrogenase
MLDIRRLDSGSATFSAQLDALIGFDIAQDAAVDEVAARILADVRARGDAAVLDYTARFDRVKASDVAALTLSQGDFAAALQRIGAVERDALMAAAGRIRAYHEHQRLESWHYTEADGTVLGQRITPIDRVGLYIPGGKAAYPSSLLMNAIPAKVAGVRSIVMVVPTPDGVRNDLVLAAAAIAGIHCAYTIGGAQAIGALAYGTATIPRVDKIVGPGNAYVAAAKRRVFGTVGIDMIAGPSEILIICDGSTDPDWIAMDLFSQAEHDEVAQAILVSPDAAFLDAVDASIRRLIQVMPRKDIIGASLAGRGALIQTKSLDEACDIANRIAPEHLELSVREPARWIEKIRHAGAIFLGRHSSESLGDYCAGPNHVLPTSGTARFSSPLGVYDFQKRSSVINVSAAGAQTLGRIAATLARGEGLPAHARSAEMRIDP